MKGTSVEEVLLPYWCKFGILISMADKIDAAQAATSFHSTEQRRHQWPKKKKD